MTLLYKKFFISNRTSKLLLVFGCKGKSVAKANPWQMQIPGKCNVARGYLAFSLNRLAVAYRLALNAAASASAIALFPCGSLLNCD
jgi:hypothetical protein